MLKCIKIKAFTCGNQDHLDYFYMADPTREVDSNIYFAELAFSRTFKDLLSKGYFGSIDFFPCSISQKYYEQVKYLGWIIE